MSLRFRPAWWSTLTVIVLSTLFIKLGFWQLERGTVKTLKHQLYLDQAAQPPLAFANFLAELPTSLAPEAHLNLSQHRWRSVEIQGYYQPELQILLDNQIHQGQAGYQVLSLLKWQADAPWLWVNRGWLPLHGNRQQIPDLALSSELQQLAGIITPPPVAPLTLANHPPEVLKTGILRVQTFNPQQLATQLKQPTVAHHILTLTEAQNSSFQPIWQPPGNDAQKHYGYMFQWFAFTVAIIIIYLITNIRRYHGNKNS